MKHKGNAAVIVAVVNEVKSKSVVMETKFMFFTGKGGVGKTSLSCATAVEMADAGKRVLLVSTDPASNLSDVLESEVQETIAPVKGLNNLYAININPEVSAEEYRNRVTDPLKDILPADAIKKIKEELSMTMLPISC